MMHEFSRTDDMTENETKSKPCVYSIEHNVNPGRSKFAEDGFDLLSKSPRIAIDTEYHCKGFYPQIITDVCMC